MAETDRIALPALALLSALLLVAGAGWAAQGEAIFLSGLMAGLAGCL